MATKAERRAAYEQRIRERELAQPGHGKQTKDARISDVLFGLRLGDGTTIRGRRFRRSVSKWSRFHGWWYMIPFGFGMACLGLGRLAGALLSSKEMGLVVGVTALPLAAGTILALIWSGFAARRELAAERAWLAALPYDVVDYEDCLGDEPRMNDGHIELAFTFEDVAPTPVELGPFFTDDLDGNWALSADGRIATMTPGPCGSNDTHNLRFARWFHRVADERLGVLHDRFPILELRLRNERWGVAARDLKQ